MRYHKTFSWCLLALVTRNVADTRAASPGITLSPMPP